MTTKDFVYLGLLLLTALAFYCHGFYSGVCRSKRVYETLLNDVEPAAEGSRAESVEAQELASLESELGHGAAFARRGKTPAGQELRGDFGPN